MDFNLEEELIEHLNKGKISQAISLAEGELKKLPQSEFHKIIGRDLLHLKEALVIFVDNFYKSAPKKSKVKAMYAEMNGFTINYDLWFINLFAFENCGDVDDLDWLADFDYYSDEILEISGLEDIQAVYKDYMENEKWDDKNLEQSCEVCEMIIILKLQQLFQQSQKLATEQNMTWVKVPLFATAHDSDIIYMVHS